MKKLETYHQQRELLLAKIIESLSNDARFVAAWITGSYARNDEDAVSDIDLTLVVSQEHSGKLCHRLEQVSARTSPERFLLFSQFGKPALIHENNNNAPESGTFTFVLYAESAHTVDWVLIPHSKATRQHQSLLLFDKVGIPVSPPLEPEGLEESKKYVAEQWAFFWMMTAITIKYIIRKDGAFAAVWIENLHKIAHEIERRINRESWVYTRGSLSKLQMTQDKQIESIRRLFTQMLELKPRVAEFIGSEPAAPIVEIETLLSFANNRKSSIANRKSKRPAVV